MVMQNFRLQVSMGDMQLRPYCADPWSLNTKQENFLNGHAESPKKLLLRSLRYLHLPKKNNSDRSKETGPASHV